MLPDMIFLKKRISKSLSLKELSGIYRGTTQGFTT